MVTEMDVLERLREKIVEGLGRVLEGFRDDSAVIDFPDTDNMRRNLMVYIQPDYEALEDLDRECPQNKLHSLSVPFADIKPSAIGYLPCILLYAFRGLCRLP